MKSKKWMVMGILFMIGVFGIPFMNVGAFVKDSEEQKGETAVVTPVITEKVEVREKEEDKEEEKLEPLTPDGNLSLVDDIGDTEGQGKQFITVVTKAGNYFYLIIDRDAEGENTVHFLNQVDEEDLLELMDEEEVKEYKNSVVEPTKELEMESIEPINKERENAEKEISQSKKIPIGILVAVIIGGVFIWIKIKEKRKTERIKIDPDEQYEMEEKSADSILEQDIITEEESEE